VKQQSWLKPLRTEAKATFSTLFSKNESPKATTELICKDNTLEIDTVSADENTIKKALGAFRSNKVFLPQQTEQNVQDENVNASNEYIVSDITQN
jgi:hypothetical protein